MSSVWHWECHLLPVWKTLPRHPSTVMTAKETHSTRILPWRQWLSPPHHRDLQLDTPRPTARPKWPTKPSPGTLPPLLTNPPWIGRPTWTSWCSATTRAFTYPSRILPSSWTLELLSCQPGLPGHNLCHRFYGGSTKDDLMQWLLLAWDIAQKNKKTATTQTTDYTNQATNLHPFQNGQLFFSRNAASCTKIRIWLPNGMGPTKSSD